MPKIWSLQAKANRKAEVLFYQHISAYGLLNAKYFNTELRKLEKDYDEILLRIHSPGGSIFEGLAMYHAMQDSPLKIVTCVDGMAASMASAIVQGGSHRQAGRFARIMVHQGAGMVGGSANQIVNYGELLKTLNKDLAEIYAEATGKSTEWVEKNWLAEGKDTWITAKEALKHNLIDEIVDSKVKVQPDQEAFYDHEQMVACYDKAFAGVSFENETETENENEITFEMKEIAKFLGLNENASEQEILSALRKRDSEAQAKAAQILAGALSKAGVLPDAKKASFERVAALDMDAALDLMNGTGGQPATASTSAATAAVVAEKKEEQQAAVQHVTMSDLLNAFKGANGGSQATGKEGWTLRDYEKKDMNALKAMIREKPEEYAKLFKAQHGKEITVEQVKALRI